MLNIFSRQPTELFLGEYQKYRVINANGDTVKNPNFNKYSGAILDVKSDRELDRRSCSFFASRLNVVLQKNKIYGLNYAVIVPSHKLDGYSRNLQSILVESSKSMGFEVEPLILRRTSTINKLASGGDRSTAVHLNSISVRVPEIVKGRSFLVIDDVWTTGNSMRACASLLFDRGASSVVTVALGKTVAE